MMTQAIATPPAALKNKRRILPDPARLLATPLGGHLLDFEVFADLYARNGFRFLGAPAWIDRARTEHETQRVRNLWRGARAAAGRLFVQTGYDDHVPVDDAVACVTRLHDPRHRIICEVFWPHVPDSVFGAIKTGRELASSRVVNALRRVESGNGREHTLAKHALAVALHNQAIAHELACGLGQADWTDSHWKTALSCWAETLNDDGFWNYLIERAKGFDDPRLRTEDIGRLRQQLPTTLLGFNALFARAYGQAGEHKICNRHLALIGKSQFPSSSKHEVLIATVRVLAVSRLEPLIQRVNTELLQGPDKMARQRFQGLCEPILAEAIAIHHYLRHDLLLSEDLAGLTEFDRLCDEILKAINRKIDYSTDDRYRSLLFSMLMTRRMLGLPLSSVMRRNLEQSLRTDAGHLYRGFELPPEDDPTQCWFLGGEEASPEASFEMPVYKITEVQGGTVRWESRQILVPRSELAKGLHTGKIKSEELARRARDDPKNRDLQEEIDAQKAEGERKTQEILAEIERQEKQPDTKGPIIQAEADRTKADCEEAVRGVVKRRDGEVQQVKDRCVAQWGLYHRQVAAQEAEDKRRIAEVQAELQGTTGAEQARCRQACDEAAAQAAGPIAEAEAAYAAAMEPYRGFRGWLRLEAPAMAIGLVIFAGLGYLTAGTGGMVFLAGILGLGAGPAVTWFIRRHYHDAASAPLSQLRQQLEAEQVRLTLASQEVLAALNQDAEHRMAEPQARLQAIADRRSGLQAEGKNQIAAVRQRAESEISRLRESAAQRVRELEQQLAKHRKARADKLQELRNRLASERQATAGKVRGLEETLAKRLRPKPETAKQDFPAYRTARSNGYKDGTKPSDYEVEQLGQREVQRFMDSLTFEDKRALAVYGQMQGNDELNRLLGALLAMSESERREKLSMLHFLGLMGRRF